MLEKIKDKIVNEKRNLEIQELNKNILGIRYNNFLQEVLKDMDDLKNEIIENKRNIKNSSYLQDRLMGNILDSLELPNLEAFWFIEIIYKLKNKLNMVEYEDIKEIIPEIPIDIFNLYLDILTSMFRKDYELKINVDINDLIYMKSMDILYPRILIRKAIGNGFIHIADIVNLMPKNIKNEYRAFLKYCNSAKIKDNNFIKELPIKENELLIIKLITILENDFYQNNKIRYDIKDHIDFINKQLTLKYGMG